MNHFLRKVISESNIYVVDLQPFREIQRLLSRYANSINQIAKRVNSTGVIYRNDINDMKKQIDQLSKELWTIHSLLLDRTTNKRDEWALAITKIHPIKSTLNFAIKYITNEDKTDEKIMVTSNKFFLLLPIHNF